MPSETFERKVLTSAAVAVAAVAHDQLVTLTKTRHHTNTPNPHTQSFSPCRCMVHGVCFFTELSLEVGHYIVKMQAADRTIYRVLNYD